MKKGNFPLNLTTACATLAHTTQQQVSWLVLNTFWSHCVYLNACFYLCVSWRWSLFAAWRYSFPSAGHTGTGRRSDTPEHRRDRRNPEDRLTQRATFTWGERTDRTQNIFVNGSLHQFTAVHSPCYWSSSEFQWQTNCPVQSRSTLIASVAVETRWAGAATVDGIAGAAIDAGAGLIAAVTIETWEALCQ